MTHNASLRSIGTSAQAVTRRILAAWAAATPADIEHGATWYSEGEIFIRDLSARTGITLPGVAAVVAHLSPRTRWSRNMYGATMLLTKGVAPTCMPANVERARKALATPYPLATLHGPKVRRFAANLLGDREAVTIDVWCAKLALGRDNYEDLLRQPGVYNALEHCYQLAARKVGVEPATMQATVWIIARNGRYQ